MAAFGIDSVWKVSVNQMQFVNSLKMKLSVIIGVTHMMLGLFVRLINGFKKRDRLDIITITIPQIIFMVTTFVYMDFLIVFKWTQIYPDTAQAPSIIATMISVYAGFSSEDDKLFWDGERGFERALVAIAFSMIPIMLLAKPIAIWIMRGYCRRLNNDEHDLVDEDRLSDDNFNYLEKVQSNANFVGKRPSMHLIIQKSGIRRRI